MALLPGALGRAAAPIPPLTLALMALLACDRGQTAAPPVPAPPMVTVSTGALSLPLIKGERRDSGDPRGGLLQVVSEPLTQMVWWGQAKGSLESRVKNEQQLMNQAADDPGQVTMGAPEARAAAPGEGSISWSAAIEETRFRSTVVSCGEIQALVSSMGPDEALVKAAQAASLAGFKCERPAAPAHQPPEGAPGGAPAGAPADAAPVDAAPVDTAPVDTAPVDAAPASAP